MRPIVGKLYKTVDGLVVEVVAVEKGVASIKWKSKNGTQRATCGFPYLIEQVA